MLSTEEKNKIALEEQFRTEVSQRFKTKSKFDLIESMIKILQGMAIIAGIWATYNAYKKQSEDRVIQEKQNMMQTAREFRKGFYDKQFEIYSEALDATSTLATENPDSIAYKLAKKKFYQLFWGRLSIVEDRTVEGEMVTFKNLLIDFEADQNGVTQSDLEQASLSLAHAASRYTINVWLDSTERKNYNR